MSDFHCPNGCALLVRRYRLGDQCIRCSALLVEGQPPLTAHVLYPDGRGRKVDHSGKPTDVLIMETLVELIDWAGPPNLRGRLLDGMQAELNRRLAAEKP